MEVLIDEMHCKVSNLEKLVAESDLQIDKRLEKFEILYLAELTAEEYYKFTGDFLENNGKYKSYQ